MALIKCRECGNEISDKAISCPQCGAPQSMKKCNECGSEISDKAISCPKCGAPTLEYNKMVGKIKMNLRIMALIDVLIFIAILFAENDDNDSSEAKFIVLALSMFVSLLVTLYWLIKYIYVNKVNK